MNKLIQVLVIIIVFMVALAVFIKVQNEQIIRVCEYCFTHPNETLRNAPACPELVKNNTIEICKEGLWELPQVEAFS